MAFLNNVFLSILYLSKLFGKISNISWLIFHLEKIELWNFLTCLTYEKFSDREKLHKMTFTKWRLCIKFFFEKYKLWAFQRRVNHPKSHPRSKVTSYPVFMIFWFSNEFAKISRFRLKLWKNLNFLQGCKNTPKHHNDRCDTAFESLN